MHHAFIGTEHILLGLLRDAEGVGGEALSHLGVSYGAARQKVEEIIGPVGSMPSDSPPFTPRAKKVLELALREALKLGHSYIGTEHILLGVVREGEGVATTVLVALGVEPARVRQEVLRIMAGYSEPTRAEGSEGSEGSSALARATATSEPCCPHCRAGVADAARFRTMTVTNDVDDAAGAGVNAADPVTIDVVYCGRCGSTLQFFRTG
jgi:ATP-dependent Clp protease ATP-binding subunit ClpC